VAGYGLVRAAAIAMRAARRPRRAPSLLPKWIRPARLEAVMDGYGSDDHEHCGGDRRPVYHRHRRQERADQRALQGNERWARYSPTPAHFNVEIDIPAAWQKLAKSRRTMRDFVEEYKMSDAAALYLLADGRLVNLFRGRRPPRLCHGYEFLPIKLSAPNTWSRNASKLKAQRVYSVPQEIDRMVARIKLDAMGVQIDKALQGASQGT